MSAVHIAPGQRGQPAMARVAGTARLADALSMTAGQLAGLYGCRAAVVYLWNEELQALVERTSSPAGRAPLGQHAYQLGEGTIGAAALRRRSAIGVDLDAGPVLRAVPVLSREDEPLAVLGLEPTAVDLPLASLRAAEDAAAWLALVIEQHASRERAHRRERLLGLVDVLALASTPGSGFQEALAEIATLGLQTTDVEACGVYLVTPQDRALRLSAGAPRGHDFPDVWPDDRLRQELLRGHGARRIEMRLSASECCATLAAPAVLDAERFGVVLLVDRHMRNFTAEEMLVAERLARTLAVAARARRLVDAAADHARPADLLWELVCPRGTDLAVTRARAQRLACDLAEPRVVLVIASGERALRDGVARAIHEVEPCALLDVAGDRITAVVRPTTLARLPLEGHSVGVSRPCTEIGAYPAGLAQAREALDLGTRLWGSGRQVAFDDLGSYRFVPALLAAGLASDAEYQQVSRLPDELLQTLEAYLDCGGNTAQAARQLFLHRNTLRQRLDRIARLLASDLSASSRWLPLQLAIKAARLARFAPQGERGEPLPAGSAVVPDQAAGGREPGWPGEAREDALRQMARR